jgi:hypothetical protein
MKIVQKVRGRYKVLSEKGKDLGGQFKAEAEKRLPQMGFFKHHKG